MDYAALPVALQRVVVRDGDDVLARGSILVVPGQAAMICDLSATRDVGYLPGKEPPVSCGPLGVAVTLSPGVQLATRAVRGGLVADSVVARGTWLNGGVVVAGVSAAELGSAGQSLPLHCDPTGNTRSLDGEGLGWESAVSALQSEVSARGQDYGGVWPVTDQAGRLLGMAVGVANNLADAERFVRSRFDIPLCFVRVEHSSSELEAAARALGPSTGSWQVEVDASINRVRLRVAVLDIQAATRIAALADLIAVDATVAPVR